MSAPNPLLGPPPYREPITSGSWLQWFKQLYIRVGQASAPSNSGILNNPMSALGDTLYEDNTPAAASLSGNTTTTKKFLTQTGTGSVSAAPAWGTIVAGDVPTLNQNTTGSAATLTTPRTINGTPFNGSANITVTAAAGTLTGATLNSTVTASSLTSVGSQAAALNMNSHKINNVTDPTSAQDAATKNYVDSNSSSPAGSDTEIQFNNIGSFGASPNLTWDDADGIINTTGVQSTFGRFTGVNVAGAVGPAFELGYQGGNALGLGYDRTGSTYIPVEIRSTDYFIKTSSNGTASPADALKVGADKITTFYGDGDLNSNNIVNLADPVSAQDGATKAYVDAALKPDVDCRYHGSSTSISGSLATITYATRDFDSNTAYSSGTYTVPYAGKYQVNASLILTGTIALNNVFIMEIQLNGTVYSRKTIYAAAALTDVTLSISDIIAAALNDTIRIQVSSGATAPSVVTSTVENFLSLCLVK